MTCMLHMHVKLTSLLWVALVSLLAAEASSPAASIDQSGPKPSYIYLHNAFIDVETAPQRSRPPRESSCFLHCSYLHRHRCLLKGQGSYAFCHRYDCSSQQLRTWVQHTCF